jgi:hypothetical protein
MRILLMDNILHLLRYRVMANGVKQSPSPILKATAATLG